MEQHVNSKSESIRKLFPLSEARREMYRFLASLFIAPPAKELVDLILSPSCLEELREIAEEDSLKYLFKFAQGFNNDYDALKQEYMDLFLIPLGKYTTPYESVFRDTREIDGKKLRGLLMGPSTLDVKRFYKMAGAETGKNFKELPDHIGTELDFLRFLCERESEAWKSGNESDALIFLKIERDFLKNHLVCWLPDLREKVFEKTKNLFYLGVVKITADFVFSDSHTLNECFC